MKQLKCLFFLAACLSLGASCRKENDNDKKNADVFSCMINGIQWKAGCIDESLFACNFIDCQYYENSSTLEIVASNTVQDTSSFHIYVNSNNGGLKLGENILDYTRLSLNKIRYNIDPCCNSIIELISIQKDKKIIEGKFNLKLVSELQDTVIVSDGYFKLKYRP